MRATQSVFGRPTVRATIARLIAGVGACLLFGLTLFACSESSTGPTSAFPDEPAPQPQPEVVAFVDVTVVPMDEQRTLPHHTVVVRGDRIESVGPVETVEVPPGAFRIEGQGRFLMPGLTDAHVHLTSETFAGMRNNFVLYLANGVTTVRVMWGGNAIVAERERIARGEILGPTLLAASPGIDGPGGPWAGSTPPVNSAEEARTRAREHIASGADFIKVYNELTQDMYDAILDEADAAGVPVVGHVPRNVSIEHVQDRGQLTLEHFIGVKREASTPFTAGVLDLSRVRELASRSAAAGVFHTPTVAVMALSTSDVAAIKSGDPLAHVSPSMRSFFENGFHNGLTESAAAQERSNQLAMLKIVKDAGGHPLVGTDAGFGWILPGYSIHAELRNFVDGGLSPFEALYGATGAPWQAFGTTDEWGSIQEGNRADLILVHENPLNSVAAVADHSGVMVRGRWLSRGTLNSMLAEIRARYGT